MAGPRMRVVVLRRALLLPCTALHCIALSDSSSAAMLLVYWCYSTADAALCSRLYLLNVVVCTV
jgi:hypothetical protein